MEKERERGRNREDSHKDIGRQREGDIKKTDIKTETERRIYREDRHKDRDRQRQTGKERGSKAGECTLKRTYTKRRRGLRPVIKPCHPTAS